MAETVADDSEETVVAAPEEDIAILSLKSSVWNNRCYSTTSVQAFSQPKRRWNAHDEQSPTAPHPSPH